MLGTDRPTTAEDLATAIWDEETGETWAEALARFDTFGPRLTASEALTLPDDVEVWAFGYGDEPEEFTTMAVYELREALGDEGVDVLDVIWGPFIVDHYHPEAVPGCVTCDALMAD